MKQLRTSPCISQRPVFRIHAGFTLLEVMVALAILTLAVATYFSALGGAARLSSNAEQHHIALVLAQAKLEEFLAQKSDVLSDERDDLTYRGVKYGFRIVATQVPSGKTSLPATPPISRLSRVQVEVFWGNEPTLRSYRLVTYRRLTGTAS